MSLASRVSIALKEWATVCHALGDGSQILLLRKGGVSETGGVFQIDHRQFLLFPTFVHQNKNMLKPAAHATYLPVAEEPSRVELATTGVVTDVLRVASRPVMDRLDAMHVWTKPLIDMRFEYKPQNPLYLVLVRAYRLPRPITIDNTPEYAGCKSWVPLAQELDCTLAAPALDDMRYEERRRAILAICQGAAQ